MTDKTGDDAEFCEFYEQTARPLWVYLSRGSESNSAADDLLQETYFRYLQSAWRKVAPAERRFYLFRIGSNVLRDDFRRRKRNTFDAARDDVRTTARDEPALEMDLANILRSEMTQRERQLLWLAYAEEFSHREIAQMTELREGSIRPLLFRARQKLAVLLTAAGYGGRSTGRL